MVIGAGISGVACGRRLHDAGIPVRLLERSRRLGGRMAVRTERLAVAGPASAATGQPHPVDVGAAYFTVSDERFDAVAQSWRAAGLARVWTDTFTIRTPGGDLGSTTSPERWAAAGGLRTLVEQLGAGLDVTLQAEVRSVAPEETGPVVDGVRAAAVVLAMPDPQAERLLPAPLAAELGVASREWSAVICVWAAWPERWWPTLDGAFVHDSAVLATVMDDGSRRGDQAPVLVAHTTSAFAAAHLDDPGAAVGPVLSELAAVLGGQGLGQRLGEPMPPPLWARAHRWTFAAPAAGRDERFALGPGLIGACGDGWGPRPRVEQAWLSGHQLAGELIERLT